MSTFASLVQNRVSTAARQGTLTRNPVAEMDKNGGGLRFLEAGSQSLAHLTSTNEVCSRDPRCKEVWDVLALAYQQGSPADKRTALTRLQSLLKVLTEEDADVAGDVRIQNLRRHLHLFLDH